MNEFNINDNVFVRLTNYGRDIYKKKWEKDYPHIPYISPEEDDDGWSKWQLWELMRAFGHAMYCGSELSFETTIRIPPKQEFILPEQRS